MTINIYLIYSVIVVISLALGYVFYKKTARSYMKKPKVYVWGIITLFFVVYAALSCWRFYHLFYGIWDFGAFDDTIRNLAFFKGFFKLSNGEYDEHFNLLLIVYAPLYWIWDSPYMLLVAQSAVMAVAGYPLFLLGRKMFRHDLPAFLLLLMFLCNPYYSRYVLYEFHAGALFPLLFFSAFLAFERGRMKTFLLLLFIAPMVKESFVIVLIAVGLFLLSRRKEWKSGLICLAMAGFWTFFVFKIWFPHIIPLQYHHSDRYPPLFDSNVLTMIKNFWSFGMRAVTVDGFAVIISFLLAFSFLPVFSPRALIFLCGPVLAIQLCALHGHQQLLMSHYSDGCNIVFPVAAAYGLKNFSRLRFCGVEFRRYARGVFFAMPVVAHIFLCDLVIMKYHNYIKGYKPARQFGILSVPFNISYMNYQHPALFHELRDIIPPGFSVVAQNNLGCFFLRTNTTYQLPGPDNADFYIFDSGSYDGFDDRNRLLKRLDGLKKNPEYACIVAQNGYLLFCRKAMIAQNRQKK